MSLSNIKSTKAEKGFTIVELLIVIVVMGILAAIIIVAYNGVTNNARNSNYKTQASQLQKVAETVNAEVGSYPTGANSAALTSSFNQTTTTKIPTGVTISLVSSAPAIDAAITNADANPSNYSVNTCTDGLLIYYPVRGGTVQTITVGNPTAC